MSIVEAPESSRSIAQHSDPGTELRRFLLARNLDGELSPDYIQGWNRDDVQYYVDQLYELSCSRGSDVLSRAELIAQMWSRSRIIPTALQCAPIMSVQPYPFKTSALSNIHEGCLNDSSSTPVALKAYRWGRQDNGLKIRKFFLEAEIWRSLSHPSILQFLGIHFQDGCLYLVSPLMKGNTLPEYIITNALSESAIVEILAQVADGLAYLHARPASIIHGDCRGANILVNEKGEPVIADFGCSMILRSNGHEPLPDWHHFSGSPRWTAPEKLRKCAHPIGTECDVYSFASLVLELLSGRLPFHHLQHDAAVVIEVLVKGRHPSCPDDIRYRELVDRVWPLLSRCWSHHPSQRPSMAEIKEVLQSLCTPSGWS